MTVTRILLGSSFMHPGGFTCQSADTVHKQKGRCRCSHSIDRWTGCCFRVATGPSSVPSACISAPEEEQETLPNVNTERAAI